MAEPGFFQEYRTALRQELMAVLGQPQPIYDMLRYHVGWRDERGQPTSAEGKMVRGVLCLAAAKAVGGDCRRALPAATAVELVHNFSLIHDDIEDASPVRRHRATVWKIWGQAQAINAGDAMLMLARLALLRPSGRQMPPDKALQAAGILDDACLQLCLGQQADLSFEGRLDIGIDDYLEMISQKTGALFEASLLLGALLGTEEKRYIRGLGAFGRKLGLAFQLQDDEMGIWGDEKFTGKSATSDIYERKKTLPIVYAFEEAVGTERQELERIYRQERLGSQDVARVLELLNDMGAQPYTQGMAEKYFHEAHADLDALGLPGDATKELRQTSDFLLSRQS